MYTIHRTRGLVLSSVARGEADRMFVIFTEQLGRIEATARSVREERSRLRYALTPYSLGEYSFVRGRGGWRIVGARDEKNFFASSDDSQKKATLERIFFLVARLVRGEGKNEELFRVLVKSVDMLVVQDSAVLVEALEILTVLRTLFVLGYISTEKEGALLQQFLETAEIHASVLEKVSTEKPTMIRTINAALAASQL